MNYKRITLFMGHYGSGKTFSAVNYAIDIKRNNFPVNIYDLDIVNPYFRTVDAKNMLESKGVGLVVSPYAETNVDIPAMNASSYKMVDDLTSYAVVDVGGDDRGALALGRFSEKIKIENNYDALLVINPFRPETSTEYGVKEIVKEIESSGRIPFTGIVNNANLGLETTEKEIIYGKEFCEKISKSLSIPLKFSCVREDLMKDDLKEKLKNVLSIKPIGYKIW